MVYRIPDYIQSLIPYVPGKPIEETQREYGIEKVIKLASNENPLGPSPLAISAVRSHLNESHRYPDAGGVLLKKALSKSLGVETTSLILGNGSNEIIDSLIRTFCLPGDAIVQPQASFIAYSICAQVHGVQTIETPVDSQMRFDMERLLQQVRENDRVKMVFLANPNNPTGMYLKSNAVQFLLDELSRIRGGAVLLVLDGAYWEYLEDTDLPSAKVWIRNPNCIVLRTFSKIYGLAGLRIGYGVAAPEIISYLEKVRQPFNVSSVGLTAAEAALGDHAFVERAKKTNLDGMKFWEKKLGALRVPYWKSPGNFILADVQAGLGLTGMELYQYCLKKGVIFRPVANYRLPHALRISIGTSEENIFAADVLAQVKK